MTWEEKGFEMFVLVLGVGIFVGLATDNLWWGLATGAAGILYCDAEQWGSRR